MSKSYKTSEMLSLLWKLYIYQPCLLRFTKRVGMKQARRMREETESRYIKSWI